LRKQYFSSINIRFSIPWSHAACLLEL
jgi:hypothetical protein